jgi:DHA2 family multidrug resistance protein-like MFS transporter
MLAAGLASTALWPLDGAPIASVALLALSGAGFGVFQVANNRNLFLSAPRSRGAAAGGMQSTARLTGQMGGAMMMTILFAMTSIQRAPRIGLAVAAVLTLVAGSISMLRSSHTDGVAHRAVS